MRTILKSTDIIMHDRVERMLYPVPGGNYGTTSFVDPFNLLCFMIVSVMLSCLFLAALFSPAGKGLPCIVCCILLCLVTFPLCFHPPQN